MTIRRLVFLFALPCAAATTNDLGLAVLIDDAGTVRPAGSVASPAMVSAVDGKADDLSSASSACLDLSTNAAAVARAALDAVRFFNSSNVVTSTVYVRSIGGVPFSASNQTVRTYWGGKTATNVSVVGVMSSVPLVTPALDWRYQLVSNSVTGSGWAVATNVACSFPATVDLPLGVTNGVAYSFSWPLPEAGLSQAYFRVVDNSTGVSGDGYWWLVYGGITVDGKRGLTRNVTNSVNEVFHFQGGVLTEAL